MQLKKRNISIKRHFAQFEINLEFILFYTINLKKQLLYIITFTIKSAADLEFNNLHTILLKQTHFICKYLKNN